MSSPDLLAAQARLLALRQARGISTARPDRFPKPVRSEHDAPNWLLRNATIALQQRRLQASVGAGQGNFPNAGAWLPNLRAHRPDLSGLPNLTGLEDHEVTLISHPTMLLAMLRQHQEVAGRVWLLLRALDADGRGWVTVDEARAHLATKDAPWRCCGWRRLRQILAAGEGVFWTRNSDGRLWLRGAHHVAHALDCERLQGYPVELPVAALLGGIRSVRAAFYAAFHSSRESKPISRDTLHTLSGLAPRTQLEYDRVARVGRRRNMAIGERLSPAAHQEHAWQRGRAVFTFTDIKGKQGRVGGEYVAWHLPNSYEGPHTRRSRGSRKRLNRRLRDLLTKGITGNTEAAVERVFWPDGAAAAKGFNRAPETDAYWQSAPTRGAGRVWQVFGRLAGQR